jgi:MFS family permease
MLMTGGGLGDLLGSRAVFMAGLAVFSAASGACALEPTTGGLIAARFAQGTARGGQSLWRCCQSEWVPA